MAFYTYRLRTDYSDNTVDIIDFTIPSIAGTYDFVVNFTDGTSETIGTITVNNVENTYNLTLTLTDGQTVPLTFVTPIGTDEDDSGEPIIYGYVYKVKEDANYYLEATTLNDNIRGTDNLYYRCDFDFDYGTEILNANQQGLIKDILLKFLGESYSNVRSAISEVEAQMYAAEAEFGLIDSALVMPFVDFGNSVFTTRIDTASGIRFGVPDDDTFMGTYLYTELESGRETYASKSSGVSEYYTYANGLYGRDKTIGSTIPIMAEVSFASSWDINGFEENSLEYSILKNFYTPAFIKDAVGIETTTWLSSLDVSPANNTITLVCDAPDTVASALFWKWINRKKSYYGDVLENAFAIDATDNDSIMSAFKVHIELGNDYLTITPDSSFVVDSQRGLKFIDMLKYHLYPIEIHWNDITLYDEFEQQHNDLYNNITTAAGVTNGKYSFSSYDGLELTGNLNTGSPEFNNRDGGGYTPFDSAEVYPNIKFEFGDSEGPYTADTYADKLITSPASVDYEVIQQGSETYKKVLSSHESDIPTPGGPGIPIFLDHQLYLSLLNKERGSQFVFSPAGHNSATWFGTGADDTLATILRRVVFLCLNRTKILEQSGLSFKKANLRNNFFNIEGGEYAHEITRLQQNHDDGFTPTLYSDTSQSFHGFDGWYKNINGETSGNIYGYTTLNEAFQALGLTNSSLGLSVYCPAFIDFPAGATISENIATVLKETFDGMGLFTMDNNPVTLNVEVITTPYSEEDCWKCDLLLVSGINPTTYKD